MTASDLRTLAAEAERQGDKWQRWANEAFSRGHARMGQSYADRAAEFYSIVSDLGERAAWAEARWQDVETDLATRQLERAQP